MRKKSHISLARYIRNNIDVCGLNKYKKSFYIGSILPDLAPSFLVRSHNIEKTFDILKKNIKKLTVEYDYEKGINKSYCRRLGVITHYLADYFTYPHNSIFEGSYKAHYSYEKNLKYVFKTYVQKREFHKIMDWGTVDTLFDMKDNNTVISFDEIIKLIKKTHTEYLKVKSYAIKDCQYILDLCYQIVDEIIKFFEHNLALHLESVGSPLLSNN